MELITWSWCPNCLGREDHDLIELRWICRTCGLINLVLERSRPVKFEEFLDYVRKHIGTYCTDKYWEYKYNLLKDRSREEIIKEMPFLAVNSIATDYASKEG